jgi:SET domain-containing protein
MCGPHDFQVRKSKIDGKGLFATVTIPEHRKLGEFGGERITLREARRRASRLRRIAIVELECGIALDASRSGTEFRYVNHSCEPNAYIRRFRQHVEFYSLRTIRPGEEITCDYGETQHDGKLPCRCMAGSCRYWL